MKTNKRLLLSLLLVIALSITVMGAAFAGGGVAPECRRPTMEQEGIYSILCRDGDANIDTMEITEYLDESLNGGESAIIYSKGNDYRWRVVFFDFACFDYVITDTDGMTYEGSYCGDMMEE